MKVLQVYLNNTLRNFNYILYSETSKEAIIFDPTDVSVLKPVWQSEGIVPKYLINTHQHYDHIAGNKKFLEHPNTQLKNMIDGEEYHLSSSEKIVCRYTPGHVDDHFCYFLYHSGKMTGVICGDTVFNAGVGNCKNGGNPGQLFETIRDIFIPLDDDVVIYPSHDYFMANLEFAKMIDPNNKWIDQYINEVKKSSKDGKFLLTTIGTEKKINPFFRVFNKDFKNYFNDNEKDLFITLRGKRDKW